MSVNPSSPGKPPGGRRGKTPRGVWVVVGLGICFVLVALGITGVILFKALAKPTPRFASQATTASPAATAKVSATTRPDEEGGGAGRPEDKPEALPAPTVVANAREEDDTRQQVLKRIDLMSELSQKEKDQLYAQVERARGFQKLAIIPFPTGKISPGTAQINELVKRVKDDQIRKLL
jgi:hypothetical protein